MYVCLFVFLMVISFILIANDSVCTHMNSRNSIFVTLLLVRMDVCRVINATVRTEEQKAEGESATESPLAAVHGGSAARGR